MMEQRDGRNKEGLTPPGPDKDKCTAFDGQDHRRIDVFSAPQGPVGRNSEGSVHRDGPANLNIRLGSGGRRCIPEFFAACTRSQRQLRKEAKARIGAHGPAFSKTRS